jgi:hypothetical protein
MEVQTGPDDHVVCLADLQTMLVREREQHPPYQAENERGRTVIARLPAESRLAEWSKRLPMIRRSILAMLPPNVAIEPRVFEMISQAVLQEVQKQPGRSLPQH